MPTPTLELFFTLWCILSTLIFITLLYRYSPTNPFKILIATGLTLIIGRFPTFFLNEQLGVDESHILAQAIKHAAGYLPWLHVDSTTFGPLISYLPTLFIKLGAPANFPLLHALALLCILTLLTTTYYTTATTLSPKAAALALIPTTLFLAFARDFNFLSYSNLHLPLCLICLATFTLSRLYKETTLTAASLTGLSLGLFPLAKLQIVPIALPIGLTALYLCIKSRKSHTLIPILLLILSTLSPLALTSLALLYLGAFDDFYIAYILNSLIYASEPTPTITTQLIFISSYNANTLAYTLASSLLAIPALKYLPQLRSSGGQHRALAAQTLFSFTLLATSLYTVLKPGKAHPYYLLLLIPPLLYLAALGLHAILNSSFKKYILPLLLLPLATFYTHWLLTEHYLRGTTYAPGTPTPYTQPIFNPSPGYDYSETANFINLHKHPSDQLAIWGYSPIFFVKTGLISATRDSHLHMIYRQSLLRPYYLQRFLRDIQNNPPAFIIEAPSSFQTTFKFPPISQFKPLWHYIQKHYTPIHTAHHTQFLQTHPLSDYPPETTYLRNDLLHRLAP